MAEFVNALTNIASKSPCPPGWWTARPDGCSVYLFGYDSSSVAPFGTGAASPCSALDVVETSHTLANLVEPFGHWSSCCSHTDHTLLLGRVVEGLQLAKLLDPTRSVAELKTHFREAQDIAFPMHPTWAPALQRLVHDVVPTFFFFGAPEHKSKDMAPFPTPTYGTYFGSTPTDQEILADLAVEEMMSDAAPVKGLEQRQRSAIAWGTLDMLSVLAHMPDADLGRFCVSSDECE